VPLDSVAGTMIRYGLDSPNVDSKWMKGYSCHQTPTNTVTGVSPASRSV
jgi:hypothetical protein